MRIAIAIIATVLVSGCSAPAETPVTPFDDDLRFLREHLEVILLEDDAGEARVAVAAQYQGRVMTSTAGGPDGLSFGWLNRKAITSGERQPHINVFGGEDRFWLGPEGGQYSIFFEAGDPFDLEHWQTPEPIDWGAWEVVERSSSGARFEKTLSLVNYSETRLDLKAERAIRVLDRGSVEETIGIPLPDGVKVVAFETENRITNTGDEAWTKDTGLVSIWILGMFNPSPQTTVVIPFLPGDTESLGPVVNDAYFGKVPEDRLVVTENAIFFHGDGEYRSKIGVSRSRALPLLGSYDAFHGVLTLVEYSLPDNATDYVNSMWEIQDQPYAGDVVNSYNDGPPEPGAAPLGPFYELETSSPAAELEAGRSLTHRHRTFHFQGPETDLSAIASATLGVTIDRVGSIFR